MSKRLLTIVLSIFSIIVISLLGLLVTIINYNSKERVEEAYNCLCNTEIFVDGASGAAGTMSEEIMAFAVIFNCKNARDLLLKLDKEATIEGKLYALCGLYYLDHDYYQKRMKEYDTSNIQVVIQSGCTGLIVNLNEIIDGNWLPRNLKKYISTNKEWMEANEFKIQNYNFLHDIFGDNKQNW